MSKFKLAFTYNQNINPDIDPVDPPIDPVDPPIDPTETCDECRLPLDECICEDGRTSTTFFCAKCWSESENYEYDEDDLESHGHTEKEVYKYSLGLLFLNENKDTFLLNDNYGGQCSNENQPLTELDTVSNENKNSIYDFSWTFNDRQFHRYDNKGNCDDSATKLLIPKLKYDYDNSKWIIQFCTEGSEETEGELKDDLIFCTIELKDGKTPLGMTGKLQDGTVKVVLNE